MKLKSYPKRHFVRQYHSRIYGWRDYYSGGESDDDDDISGCLIWAALIIVGFMAYAYSIGTGVVLTLVILAFLIDHYYTQHPR